MKAESIGLRRYALLGDGGERIATLSYEGWLTSRAVAEFEDGTKLKFRSQDFWGQTTEVKQEDTHLATIKTDWLGNVKIFFDKEKEPRYILKYSGFWQPKIVLNDSNKNKIAEFIGHFKWSKFTYEYEISPSSKDALVDDKLLIMSFFAAMHLFRLINSSAE